MFNSIMNALGKIGEADFDQAPTFLFMKKLRDELITNGLALQYSDQPRTFAADLVSSMDIDLGHNCTFTDTQLDQLASAYGDLILKASNSLLGGGFGTSALFNAAKKFTLKLT